MPTVRRYVENNPKDGFYLRANPGYGRPISVQTTDLANQIFEEMGITDGDTITHDLCWAMYNAGLLWTENSGIDDADATLTDDGAALTLELTVEQKSALASILQNYTDDRIDELRNLLDETIEIEDYTSSDATENPDEPNSTDTTSGVTEIPNPLAPFSDNLESVVNGTHEDYNAQQVMFLKELSETTVGRLKEMSGPDSPVISGLPSDIEYKKVAPDFEVFVERIYEYCPHTPEILKLREDGSPMASFPLSHDMDAIETVFCVLTDYTTQSGGSVDAAVETFVFLTDEYETSVRVEGAVSGDTLIEYAASPQVSQVMSGEESVPFPVGFYVDVIRASRDAVQPVLDSYDKTPLSSFL